jgi:hypothetical protein
MEDVRRLEDLWNEPNSDPGVMIQQYVAKVQSLSRNCEGLCLPSASKQARLIRERLEGAISALKDGRNPDLDEFPHLTKELRRRILEDLEDRVLFILDRDKAEGYFIPSVGNGDRVKLVPKPLSQLFGEDVCKNFPSAMSDLREAVICLAMSRSTATVLHLMRALEVGLSALAKYFSVPSDNPNWQNLIERIEKSIREIGNDAQRRPTDWKEQQMFFSNAATHFMFIKDAWRNHAAHGRVKYTEEEAAGIFGNVRGFMQKIATRLSE